MARFATQAFTAELACASLALTPHSRKGASLLWRSMPEQQEVEQATAPAPFPTPSRLSPGDEQFLIRTQAG